MQEEELANLRELERQVMKIVEIARTHDEMADLIVKDASSSPPIITERSSGRTVLQQPSPTQPVSLEGRQLPPVQLPDLLEDILTSKVIPDAPKFASAYKSLRQFKEEGLSLSPEVLKLAG